MNDHEIEIAAQVAVDVVSDYLGALLLPIALDELKGRILRKFQGRFESMTFKEQV